MLLLLLPHTAAVVRSLLLPGTSQPVLCEALQAGAQQATKSVPVTKSRALCSDTMAGRSWPMALDALAQIYCDQRVSRTQSGSDSAADAGNKTGGKENAPEPLVWRQKKLELPGRRAADVPK